MHLTLRRMLSTPDMVSFDFLMLMRSSRNGWHVMVQPLSIMSRRWSREEEVDFPKSARFVAVLRPDGLAMDECLGESREVMRARPCLRRGGGSLG